MMVNKLITPQYYLFGYLFGEKGGIWGGPLEVASGEVP